MAGALTSDYTYPPTLKLQPSVSLAFIICKFLLPVQHSPLLAIPESMAVVVASITISHVILNMREYAAEAIYTSASTTMRIANPQASTTPSRRGVWFGTNGQKGTVKSFNNRDMYGLSGE